MVAKFLLFYVPSRALLVLGMQLFARLYHASAADKSRDLHPFPQHDNVSFRPAVPL